ncbi:hypothetical protein A9404_09450 [Halothiobacillus diazotrophicus]|uniref:Cytoskeleton protein RodZ-like C-terminal domain-containing protein n=1 Tax=Halothiobacillus diazotrophicus TaxID=1860122 RepID=A0A191ZI62_9GAMM|nr:RodZ domain-containing protein [Halothiobacillus diazotrophicus]ANJ67586.1 hypothetical protein A9404_09450 [Halothiobacillus diazotrophicus]
MSQGHSQGDHQEPILPPLTSDRPAEDVRNEEFRPVQNLGKAIQAARIAKDMTTADLAQSLNLDLRIVEAIEANRFEDAPEPIYVRAYLKHWASLLDVDAQSWIDVYNTQIAQESGQDTRKVGARPTLDVMAHRKSSRTVHGHKSGGRFWRVLVSLVLLGGAAAVVIFAMPTSWQQWVMARLGGHESTTVVSDRAVTLVPLAPPGTEVATPSTAAGPGTTVPLASPSTSSDAGNTSPAPETGDAATDTKTMLPALPATPPAGVSDEAASSDAPAPAPVPASTEPTESPATTTAASASSAETAPAADLEIKATSADCWVEVRNAAGKRLVYDVLKSGETRRVPGSGPFTVVLGNAAAVEVLWKGAPVKLGAPNATTGVVRTTIGG